MPRSSIPFSLGFLLSEVENLTGKVVFILAGYQRPMEKFFAHNPGLPSRIPHELEFNDYEDNELLQILEYGIKKKYRGQMKVEGGFGGLYCRIVARRVGRGRGHEGFANARAIENTRSRIADRQSNRLKQERKGQGFGVDDFLLTKEDLIGAEPSQVLETSYGLFGGGTSDGHNARSDIFRTAVVDTIVAEIQSNPGADQCVLLLGYKEHMQRMFQHVNPGISRRFPMDQAFEFEDFTEGELDRIVTLKLKEQGFDVTDRGRKVALEMPERAGNRSNFGNAGEIDILLNSAKMRHQKHLASQKHSARALMSTLDAKDFDENYDRGDREGTSVASLFEGVVGSEEIIAKLESYRQMVKNLRKLNMDPRGQVPFNFLFRGPPGTGKTSTARKMGQIYYDMGLLASADVVETSATDFVGQYVGHTGPKTEKALESALGKVVFIDEAYRLADGRFAKEAIDQIVDCITKPKVAQRLIIILAGYDADINHLMSINPGLTSRFPESIRFNPLPPADCVNLLTQLLQKRKKDLQGKGNSDFDLSCLEFPRHDFSHGLTRRFERLSNIANWANARDVETLAKAVFGQALQALTGKTLIVKEAKVLAELDAMIDERVERQQY